MTDAYTRELAKYHAEVRRITNPFGGVSPGAALRLLQEAKLRFEIAVENTRKYKAITGGGRAKTSLTPKPKSGFAKAKPPPARPKPKAKGKQSLSLKKPVPDEPYRLKRPNMPTPSGRVGSLRNLQARDYRAAHAAEQAELEQRFDIAEREEELERILQLSISDYDRSQQPYGVVDF